MEVIWADGTRRLNVMPARRNTRGKWSRREDLCSVPSDVEKLHAGRSGRRAGRRASACFCAGIDHLHYCRRFRPALLGLARGWLLPAGRYRGAWIVCEWKLQWRGESAWRQLCAQRRAVIAHLCPWRANRWRGPLRRRARRPPATPGTRHWPVLASAIVRRRRRRWAGVGRYKKGSFSCRFFYMICLT